MRFPLPSLMLVALLPALSLLGEDRADDAILTDGRRLHGKLAFGTDQRLHFTAEGSAASPPLAEMHDVRFSSAAVRPWLAGAMHTVLLRDSQRLTGQLLGLDENQAILRTPGADRLTIPRHAIRAITQLPGYLTFLEEDFVGLSAWKRKGMPQRSEHRSTSGRYSLLLRTPGQQAELALPAPLAAGRIAINFYRPIETAGAHWKVEAEFDAKDGSQTFAVIVAGLQESYAVEAPGIRGEVRRLAPAAGWHRLALRFAREYFFVGIDDVPIWLSERRGPGGALHKLRLACVASSGESAVKGEIYFDDLTLARTVADLPRSAQDPGQDEVWLASGDQLFGRVLRADHRTVTLQGPFGKRILLWGEVRGVYPRRASSPLETTDGEQVRIWLRPATGATPDELSGVLRALDDRHLVLRHAVLGDVEVERARLQRLRFLFHGRHIELDNDPHHLGPPNRVVPTLQPARAEGLSLRQKFHLDAVPESCRLLIRVSQLKGTADGIATALQRGELRLEVVVNGQTVDYLNRHADRSLREVRELTIPLPRQCLRTGENVLELRQTPEAATGHCESCGVSGLALDIMR